MKNYYLIPLFLLLFTGIAWADEISLSINPINAKFGNEIIIHASMPSYENYTLRYYIDVFDSSGKQIDSTLWFVREDFNYTMRTFHPAYQILKGGEFTISVELAINNIERTGKIVKTISFFISNPSPLYQIKGGVLPKDVICNEGLELIFKSSNSMPACVYHDTVDKLIELNWAQYYPSKVYLEDGRISASDQFLFPQIFEFELKRQGIYYENIEGKEKYRNPDSLPSNPWRACSELIGEDGNRFYASIMVIQYMPLITEKVEFDNILPDHCEKWYYEI